MGGEGGTGGKIGEGRGGRGDGGGRRNEKWGKVRCRGERKQERE